MNLERIGRNDVDWIHLAQDSVQRLALVNTLTTLEFHERQGIS
jgi:hypothetical protein